MSISQVSYISSIANLATQMKAENVQLQWSVAMLKQIQEMDQMMGDALVEMMELSQAISSDLGTVVDVSA